MIPSSPGNVGIAEGIEPAHLDQLLGHVQYLAGGVSPFLLCLFHSVILTDPRITSEVTT